MGEVIEANIITDGPIPPAKILAAGLEQDLKEVIVIGYKEDGELYLASSSGDLGVVAFLLLQSQYEVVRLGSK